MTIVARLVGSFPPFEIIDHGLDPNFYYLSKEQAKLGLEVHVFTVGSGKIVKTESQKSLTVHRIPFPYNINILKELLRLKSSGGVDLIHTHATKGISTVFMKKRLATPIIGQIHGTSLPHAEKGDGGSVLDRRGEILTKVLIRYAILRQKSMWSRLDQVFAVSRAIARSLIKYYSIDPSKIRILHNAVDPHLFKPQSRRLIHEIRERLSLGYGPIILFVGSFRPVKGIQFLLTAMKSIVSDFPDTQLVLIGGIPRFMRSQASYYLYLKRCAIDLGISDSVRFFNKVPHMRMPLIYSMADIVVIPSLYESFGKVAVEAMACETPVIASNVGGLPEIIDNGIDGFLVDVGSVEMISLTAKRLLNNCKAARKMGQRGRRKVLSKFTWDKIARKSLKYYDELIGH